MSLHAMKLEALAARCRTFFVRYNDHLSSYGTVEAYLNAPHGVYDEPEATAACIAADRVWEVRVYPKTPVGFLLFYGPELEPLLDEALEHLPAPRVVP